ncbi:hypothetical protein P5W98_14300 [Paraburkholderia sp. A1BS-2L]|uniref:hypothetical protein n=1 Tax=Paraburkholderia sp. A1BS-2L TaxID=3028373 RepID=UPI003DA833BD
MKSFTHAQGDAAARRLDALPEKPAHVHGVNVREAMKSMQPQIIDAQRKGYAQEEIVRQIAHDGVQISAGMMRYAVRHALEDQQPAQADKGRTITPTAKTNVRSPAKKAGQADITRNEMLSRVIGVAMVSKPIRGFLGFPTSPDTESL